MNHFQENNCRLCSKIFCCEKCRIRHEENIHKVNSECEICIYGRMTIKNASVTLLHHIKSTHWPLHCIFCKKIFSSLDDLIPHDKCAVKIENIKMQETPPTPITPVAEKNDPSPMITPFYKTVPGHSQVTPYISMMAITSTPLVHKTENDKITPVNASDIKCVYKSSLKLTGSSNLSDSKKSERRVTFSETPSVSDSGTKKPKYLPMDKQTIKEQDPNDSFSSNDDSYVSFKDDNGLLKSASSSSHLEDKENEENLLALCPQDSGLTVWESALTQLGVDVSKKTDSINAAINHINVSLQINVFNDNFKSDDSVKANSFEDAESESLNKTTSIWSSMTNIVKSMVNNISLTAQNSFSGGSTKRSLPDNDAVEEPSYKKRKFSELKCRRPIRDISPLYQIRLGKPRYVDKATQTDQFLL